MKLIDGIKERITWADCLYGIFPIKVEDIPLNPLTRLKCQNCGLSGRHPTCPPNVPSYDLCKEFFSSFKKGLIFVFKSDGKISWKEEGEFVPKDYSGRQLKGVEAGMSRYIRQKMYGVREYVEDKGFFAEMFLPGHCLNGPCGKKNCPLRDKRKGYRNVTCGFDGTRSLEAMCIDCFKLMDFINVDYDLVVQKEVTLVGLVLYKKGEGKHLQKDMKEYIKMKDIFKRMKD